MRRIPLLALGGHESLVGLIGRLRRLLEDVTLSPATRAEAGFQLGRVLMNADEWEAAATELEHAVPGLAHRPADLAWAMILLGHPTHSLCPAEVHRRWLDRGWAVAQDAAIPEDVRLVLAVNRISALLVLGEETGWAAAANLPADASKPHHALQVTRNLVNMAEGALVWGRYSDARRWVDATLEMADKHGFARLHGRALGLLVRLDWLTGAWGGLAERAAALAQHDEPLTRLAALLVGGLLDVATGACQSGVEKLELVTRDTLQYGLPGDAAESYAALACLRLASGQIDDALTLTEDPLRLIVAKRIWIRASDILPARVQALTASGKESEAKELATAFSQGLRGRQAPAPRAAALLCRGLLAEAAGEQHRAAAMFGRAAQAWHALPRPYEALLAGERQARCLIAVHKSDTGFSLLSTVTKELVSLGATRDAGRLAAVLREHGVAPPNLRGGRRGRRGYGDQLSPRELEVVRLLAQGQTDREIAASLVVAPKTVAYHLDSARRKLGAHSRTALLVAALAAGVIPEPAAVHADVQVKP